MADAKLTYEQWKAKYAPEDSGQDYDLRGAYEAGLVPSANQHFPDTFKLPGHPTFSIESKYWKPGMPAGRWEGEKFIPMDAKTAAEWVKTHGQNMPESQLQKGYEGIIETLKSLAQPRPDITSKVERPYTYAGRVVSGLDQETPQSIMSRSPIGELEAGGQAASMIPKGLLVAGMAKQFRPAAALSNEEIAARLRAQFESGELRQAAPAARTIGGKVFRDAPKVMLAPAGAKPLSRMEEMWPALVNEKTGEVIYREVPYKAGVHKEIWESLSPEQRLNLTRSFVDPRSRHAFTEAQMEQHLMDKWFQIKPHPFPGER